MSDPSLDSLKEELLALLLEEDEENRMLLTAEVELVARPYEQASPLSFSQQRLWFLDQYEPASALYNISIMVRVDGKLDDGAFARCLNEIVRRHEALRTVFTTLDGTPVQVIVKEWKLALTVNDLSGLPYAEREGELLQLAKNEAKSPFDLSTGPLIRASLVKLASAEQAILFTMHHIVSDGWSMGVLVNEVAALYGAYVQGKASPLPELSIQYADYAHWQRQWLAGEVLQQQLGYWNRQLSGAPGLLELPTDRPRPSIQTSRGSLLKFKISKQILDGVYELGKQTQTTLFMALNAVFSILLSRYANQSDICIGMPIANRNRAEIESLIGFFVNTLVLRTQVDGNAGFDSLLQQVKATTLDAYAHQDVPFEQLVEALKPERHTSHSPLFQVALVLNNAPLGALEMPGLTLKPLVIDSAIAKFDLTLNVTEGEDQLYAVFEYNTDLFDESTIRRMAGHFTRLLEAIVADPGMRVADLPMLGEEERQQLLVEWNATATEYRQEVTIHQLFEEQAEKTPENIAVIFEGRQLTYAELNTQANRLAHYLRDRGVGPDVLVGICVERSLEMIVGLLGILKAGGAYVPLDPAYPQERLAYMLDDAKPAVLLTQQHLLGTVTAGTIPAFCIDSQWEELSAYPGTNPDNMTLPGNLAYVIYTSGSTGKPKGALLQHSNVSRLFAATDAWFGFSAQDTWTLFHSYAFDFSVWEIWGALLHGGKLVVVPYLVSRSPDQFHALLAQEQVTILNQTPSAFQQLVEIDLHQATPSALHLRQVIFGGEALNQAALAPWFEAHGYDSPGLINMYGITETTVHVTYQPLQADSLHPLSVGRPIPDLGAYILDADLNPVPVGVPGELHVSGEGLARGYLNRPALTAEKFIANPFSKQPGARMYRSGDLARYLPDGNIEYLGRIDNQVKIRGFRIELGEIEAALAALPQVRDVVVLAREDQPGDRRLVAYLVVEEGQSAPEAAELRNALLQSLPEYMVPAHFMVLEAMPLTSNGKVDRKALPAPDTARSEVGYVAPSTETEATLAGIWAEVLKLDRVGIHDNFFALGGHSLLVIALIERMRRAGLYTDVRTLFATPTIAALAAASGAGGHEIEVPPNRIPAGCESITPDMLTLVQLTPEEIAGIVNAVPGGAANIQDIYPLAPLQEGILFHHLMNHEGDTYLLPSLIGFDTRERLDGFIHALQSVIDRHDILRTAVLWDGLPEPVQVVLKQASIMIEEVSFNAQDGDVAQQIGERYNPRHSRLDVREAPLMRGFAAHDAANGRWLLQILAHHLVSDHTTLELLVEEVQMILQGHAQQLPKALPFRNFVAQARLGVSQVEHEAFFRKMLSHVDEPTAPFGLLNVQGDGSDIKEARREVDPALAKRIRRHARSLGVSAASLMHLAWAIVLSKVSGREDVVFGTVLFGRMQGGDGADRVLGMFINSLPVCINAGNDNIANAVRRTHTLLTQLLRHEHASLALAQRCSGVISPMPLFSSLLNYRHSAVAQAAEPAAHLAWEGMEALGGEERTNYPLTLSIDDLGEGFLLTAQVSVSVRAQRICDYMHNVLEHLSEALETATHNRVNQIEVLSAAERQQLLVEWNATATEYRQEVTIHQLFEEQAEKTPENIAVIFEGRQLTYAELNTQANRLAHYLRDRGVGPDVLVGICVERSLEMIVGLLGILKAGGAYVPLDPAYPQERLAYMLDDAKPAVLLTQQHLLGTVTAGTIPAFCIDSQWEELSAYPGTNPDNMTLPGNLAYVIYTSGSTGWPKGAGIDHAGIVNRLQWMQQAYMLTAADRVLQKTPFSFDVSVWEFFWPVMYGATLVVATPGGHQDPVYLSSVIGREGVTTLHFVPPMLDVFLGTAHLDQCGSLRQVICSGQALPWELQQRFFAKLPQAQLHNLYGPTEASVDVTYWQCDRESASGIVPIGWPIANIQMHILDADLNPVPAGVAGELHIAGIGLARGYMHRPALTAEKFIANPFSKQPGARMYRSGDLARYLPDGNIEYLGRIDNQVKIRGFRIELGEIEAALAALPQVRDVVVLAREDQPGDRRLVAYLVVEEGQSAPEAAELRNALLQSLPEYMVPAHFMVLEAMPLTSNGKVDRKALPAPDTARSEVGYVAPSTETEATLAGIWAEVLKLDRVGIHDNFFALGGHSLLVIALIERMRRAGLYTDVRTLFATPTIAALAAASGAGGHEIEVPPNRIPAGCESITPDMLTLVQLTPEEIAGIVNAVPGGAANIQDIYPLAPLQEGILFHHLMNHEGDTYLLPSLIGFDTRERLDGFIHALQSVIDRHDILRTAVLWDGLPEPVQVVLKQASIMIEEVSFNAQDGDVAQQIGERYNPRHSRLDVREAPLMRGFAAHDAANGRWLLQILAHHLVSDHTTLELLVEEVQMILQGHAQQLPKALPFRNFVAQARLGVSQVEHEAFFRKMLSHVDEPTAPFGLLNVQGDGSDIKEARREVDPALAKRIRRHARSLGVSAASLMHLAWAIVLSKVSGREDVVFGTVLFGRMQGGDGADRVLGMFINSLPVCINAGNDNIANAVRRTHTLLTQLLRHEHASLALAQRCSGVISPMPLFSSLLNYRHSAVAQAAEPAAHLAWEGMEALGGEERTNYPLTLSIDDLGEGFLLTAQVSVSVRAQRICDYMHNVLEHLSEALETATHNRVNQIEVLSAAERQQLLVEWNATATEYRQEVTIHQLFEEQAEKTPENIAVIFEGRQLTYAELNTQANRLAHYLRDRGVGPDVLVGICVERSLEMIVGLLGILKAGGAYVPLDPAYPQERLAYMLDDAKPAVLLTQQHLLGTVTAGTIPAFCIDSQWEELSAYPGTNPDNMTLPGNLAYVIYTSGSTGRPKGTLVPQSGLSNLLAWFIRQFGIDSIDKVLLFSSTSFDLTQKNIFSVLLVGGQLHVPPEGYDPDKAFSYIQKNAITFLNCAPSAFYPLLTHFSKHEFLSLRQVFLGGEAIQSQLLHDVFFNAPCSPVIHNTYGPTEASDVVSFFSWDPKVSIVNIPIGRPIANTQLYLLDNSLNPMPTGVPGEVYVAGDGVARGYLNRPDLTADRFIPDPFSHVPGARMYRSGDLARYLADGNIEYLGRIDNQVKIRGFRIELGEIEAALAVLPDIRDVIVLAREDIPGDKRLVAYIAAQRETGAGIDVEELRARLLRLLPDYMVPAHFMFLDHLPLTPNGKIDRKALPAPEMTRSQDGYVAPRTPHEAALAFIWAGILKLDKVGVKDNFFTLGGHSLLATNLMSRIRQTFKVELGLRVLFEASTIETLAQRINLVLQDDVAFTELAIVPVDRNNELPLSFAQQRLWFLDQLESGSAFYNISTAVRLLGELDESSLRRTLNEIVRRHEALRTVFTTVDGTPVQVVVEELELALTVNDLSGLPHAEREAKALWLAQDDAQMPFDLSTGPLIRAGLIRLGEMEHVVLFTVHHIVSDGWSMGVLVNEVAALYGAYVEGNSSPLPNLPVQYADFAYWQRQWLSGDVLQQQLGYWATQLVGSPTLLELPTDRPRPAIQTHSGATLTFVVPAEITQNLYVLGKETQTTLFMSLAAAFNILLARYSGQNDICIGTAIANRNRAEIESLIGFFVNTLVLRTQVDGNAGFDSLLQQVKGTTLDAYAHQDVPFEHLVDILKPERHTSHSPLFQVMLVLQNAPMDNLELPGLTLQPMGAENTSAKFDLTLFVVEGDGRLFGSFEYNTDLFDESTIRRMAGHFTRLLEAIVADPGMRVADLPMLGEEERQQLLVEWNATATEYRQEVTIHQLFEEQAEKTPENIAVIFEGRQLTYAELNTQANRLAHYLRDRGVGPDVLVGICVERSLEMIVGLLGILKAGGAYVPLDPAYPQERLAYMLDDAKPAVLLTQQHLLGTVTAGTIPAFCIDSQWEELSAYPGTNPDNMTLPGNLAYVIYTSGSTGRPKGVGLPIAALTNLLTWQVDKKNRNSANPIKILQFASLNFDVSFQEILSTLCAGDSLTLVDDSLRHDLERLRQFIFDEGFQRVFLPNAVLQQFAGLPLAREGITAYGNACEIITAGEQLVITDLLITYAKALGGDYLYNQYGPSETHVVTQFRLTCADMDQWPKSPPIGRPIDNTLIHILDDNFNPVPVGVPGELYIAGECLARGYLNRPDLTADKFVPNPYGKTSGARMYKSGDLARYLVDGTIEFMGRIDNQVKIRGFRVELGEIETVLTSLPSVHDVAVVVREDIPGNKRLVAYLVCSKEQSPVEVIGLRGSLLQTLPDYMVPAHFMFLDHLPLTPNGKVNRRALPAPDMIRSEIGYVAARTPTEQTLATIWAELLKLDRVGINDNFFDLGGHSLLATQVISKVRALFQSEIPLRALFEAPTVETLAKKIEDAYSQRGQITASIVVPVDRNNELPLSFAQQRLWFLDQLESGSAFYNISTAVRLLGELDESSLRRTLNEIVRRHEALRTVFTTVDGTPVQVVVEELELALTVNDLSGLPHAEREAKALWLAQDDAQMPFDLSTGPLIRAGLIRLGEMEHVVLFTVHHIVSDGWSMGVLVNEVAALYGAYVEGNSSPLPNLPVQYADFAYWQRQWLSGDVLQQQLGYWATQLVGSPTLLELPTDRPRPAIQTHSGATLTFVVPAEITQNLYVLGKETQTTLFMSLAAAFNILLARYSGQNDICIGTAIANRNRAEIESLIGFFVNTLVLRTQVDGNAGFDSLLQQVKGTTLDAYAHQDVPFEHLVDILKPERHTSHSPLFQVMLVLQNAPMDNLELPGLTLQPMGAENTSAKFDLTLFVVEGDGRLFGSFEYNTDLFDESTIRRMAGHFTRLLEAIVADPGMRVADLPMLGEEERQQLLVEWNATATEYRQEVTIHQLFEEQAEKTPENIAVIFEGRQLTYAELNTQANRLAHYLRDRGVGPDVLVGICVERSLEMIVGLLGILKAGGAYVPLDPAYPQERLAYMLDDAKPAVLLTQQHLLGTVTAGTIPAFCIDSQWEELSAYPGTNPDNMTLPGNLAYVIYTSGSTGKPKGALLQHSNVSRLFAATDAWFGFSAQDTWTLFHSYAFDFSVWEIWGALLHGGKLVVVPYLVSRSPDQFHALLAQEQVTILNQTPSAFQQLVEIDLHQATPSALHLRQVIFGGEALNQAALAPWFEAHGYDSPGLINMYGITETTVHVTYQPLQADSLHPLSVGRPIPDLGAYILDADLNPVPVGVPGELHVSGEGLARGYLNRPALTAEKFIANPFSKQPGARMYRSGDLARYLPDGNIEYLGRIDNQVKIRGFRIELGEIEAALAALPQVRDVVVLAREDQPGDRRLVAYLVVEEGQSAPEAAELRNALLQSLPEYMVPAHFMVLEAMPLTSNGKVDRKALPAPDTARSEVGYVAPSTETEATLAGIWAAVLKLDRVGIHDNFFALGGNSLLIIKVHSQLSVHFGNRISVVDLFKYPTIDKLSCYVNETPLTITQLPDSFARGESRRQRSTATKKRIAARAGK